MKYIDLTRFIASESKCQKRKVGAVIINKDKRILSTGYNGTPSGAFECSDYFKVESDHYYINIKLDNLSGLFKLSNYMNIEPDKYFYDSWWIEVHETLFRECHKKFAELYETHAEVNAILNLLKTGTSKPDDLTVYVTCEPCLNCRKTLVAAGIRHVVYKDEWDKGAIAYFDLFGGACEQAKDD